MLVLFTSIVEGMLVYPDRMRENMTLTRGLEFSQRVLLSLIEHGLSREDAYDAVQRNAMQAWERREAFLELLAADDTVARVLSPSELESLFDYQYYLAHTDVAFDRLGLQQYVPTS